MPIFTEKYAILGYYNYIKCYNFETNELETISYDYNFIVGSYDNKIIGYDLDTNTMTIYNVDEINEPVVLSQISYSPEGAFRMVTRKLDDSHVFILLNNGFSILNIESDNNHFIETTINVDLNNSGDWLYPPVKINNNLIYFASEVGENFVYDISDISSPQQVNYLFEENIRCNNYCIAELDSVKYIYKQSQKDGIRRYNVENIFTSDVESYGVTYPLFSSAFVQGIIYTIENDTIIGVDPNTSNVVFQCEFPYNHFRYYSQQENLLILETSDDNNQSHVVIMDSNNELILEDILLQEISVNIYKDLVFCQNNNEIKVRKLNSELIYELVATLPASSFSSISLFDENLLWISYSGGNYIFNCETYTIEQDFQSEFQYGLNLTSLVFRYGDRMIMTTLNPMNEHFVPSVKLYDIEDIANPILLDTKYVTVVPLYYEIDDLILETQYSEPVNVYNKFSDSFTESIQELDFNTFVHNLVFDPENNRVTNISMYNLKTFTYETTENGLIIVPELEQALSNYPNPFNPHTIISYILKSDTKVRLEIFNIKGQKVKTLLNETQDRGEQVILWNGKDDNDKSVSSGVYLYKLKTDYDNIVRRMVLLK